MRSCASCKHFKHRSQQVVRDHLGFCQKTLPPWPLVGAIEGGCAQHEERRGERPEPSRYAVAIGVWEEFFKEEVDPWRFFVWCKQKEATP